METPASRLQGAASPPAGVTCCPRMLSGWVCLAVRGHHSLDSVLSRQMTPHTCSLLPADRLFPRKSNFRARMGFTTQQPRNLRFSCTSRSREHWAVVCDTSLSSSGEEGGSQHLFLLSCSQVPLAIKTSMPAWAHLGPPCQLASRLLHLQSKQPASVLRVVCSHQVLFVY